MLTLAAIMSGVAILLLAVGTVLAARGGDGVVEFGWLTIGWGSGGLCSALVLTVRAWRR